MDKNFKKKWVEALRSGKYEQTRSALKKKKDGKIGFCCLGVACDIAKGGKWMGDEIDDYDGSTNFTFHKLDKLGRINPSIEKKYGDHSGYMPDWLAKKIGLAEDDQEVLASRNDDGSSFKEIAKYIEENL